MPSIGEAAANFPGCQILCSCKKLGSCKFYCSWELQLGTFQILMGCGSCIAKNFSFFSLLYHNFQEKSNFHRILKRKDGFSPSFSSFSR
jgi:hypothetical protein